MGNLMILLIGLPGSGKSTYAAEIAENSDAVVISSDDIREQKFGHSFDEMIRDSVFRELINQAVVNLLDKKEVILDTTFLNDEESRYLFISEVKKQIHQVYVRVIFFDTNLCKCIIRDRNRQENRRVGEHVIKRLNEKLSLTDSAGLLDEVIIKKNS